MPASEMEILHLRYQQQARWTQSIRTHILARFPLNESSRILELGCGTGVILKECRQTLTPRTSLGIDMDAHALKIAAGYDQESAYAQNNALTLPFGKDMFDLIFCHFFLLWAKPLAEILAESLRVLRPRAAFIAFAEPDYGGRLDFPLPLSTLGKWQAESLQQQGADTQIGRKLAFSLTQMGLVEIEYGVLGGEWHIQTQDKSNDNTESLMFKRDLMALNPKDPEQLNALLAMDMEAQNNGLRFTYVPTFYAFGIKPELNSRTLHYSVKDTIITNGKNETLMVSKDVGAWRSPV